MESDGTETLRDSKETTAASVSEKVGIHIPPEDPQALSDEIRDLYKDPTKLKLLARNSLAAASNYSREEQARHMILVLERAVLGRGYGVDNLLTNKVGDKT